MFEKRKAVRDDDVRPAISAFVELPDGKKLEGLVVDVSDTGARVAADATDLKVGDEAVLTLVIQAHQKVVCRCQVKHIEPNKAQFGVNFISKAQVIKEKPADPAGQRRSEATPAFEGPKLCPVDGRRFPGDYRFCPFDRAELITVSS
jgi:hypothetical protein